MFSFHSSFSMQILVLLAAVCLLIWALRHEGKGVLLAKFFGTLAIILMVFSLACSAYYNFKYWKHDYYKTPFPMANMMHMKMKAEKNKDAMQSDNTMDKTMMNKQDNKNTPTKP